MTTVAVSMLHGSDPSDHGLCDARRAVPGGLVLAHGEQRVVHGARGERGQRAVEELQRGQQRVGVPRQRALRVRVVQEAAAGGARYDITYIQGWHAPITFFHSDSRFSQSLNEEILLTLERNVISARQSLRVRSDGPSEYRPEIY